MSRVVLVFKDPTLYPCSDCGVKVVNIYYLDGDQGYRSVCQTHDYPIRYDYWYEVDGSMYHHTVVDLEYAMRYGLICKRKI